MQTFDTPSVCLRALEPADVEALYGWENDPAVWGVSAAHQPFSRYALQRFIDECSGSDIYASRQLRLMADAEGQAVGCIDLYDFDPYHRRAGIGIIVDRSQRGKGYATAMLHSLEAFAAEHLSIHQLYCDIALDNQRSISLFTKCGFIPCGTMSQWVWNGTRWTDACRMQKIIEI